MRFRKLKELLNFALRDRIESNPADVKNLMGHKSAKLTLEVYAKVNEVSKRALADKLGNYVLGEQAQKLEGVSLPRAQ